MLNLSVPWKIFWMFINDLTMFYTPWYALMKPAGNKFGRRGYHRLWKRGNHKNMIMNPSEME